MGEHKAGSLGVRGSNPLSSTILFLVVLLLSGCAAHVYSKTGIPDASRTDDYAECVGWYSGPALWGTYTDWDGVDQCMARRGYTVVQP